VETRHVLLEGSLNLRDIGGYTTADGRLVRVGRIFRSDELHGLTDDDLVVVAALGIRVVFDLRNVDERNARPNRLPDGIELLERVTPSTQGPSLTTEEQIVGNVLPVADDEAFADIYRRLLEMLAPELRIILERALDAPSRPLLFHCAAGKDRTGIATAVLLGLLGVPDDLILDDYELTTRFFTARKMDALAGRMAEYGVTEERLRPLLEARRPVLEALLHHVRDRWGGFDGYACEHVGLDAGFPERLRAALLV
jgi:protein-tyrosine phosphatase